MDKETLSNYGWIVICVLVLAVMLALATPFGNFISTAVKSTTQGLFDTNKNALNSTGLINIGDQSFDDGASAPEIKREAGSVIPDGATYTPNGGTAIAGNGTNKFPNTPQTGDTYEEGDYIYKYNQYYNSSFWWSTSTSQNGWGVSVRDTSKTTYGEIISEIAGQQVKNMSYTFYCCSSITTAPAIPNSVTNMDGTFSDCTSLTTAPTIPSSVTNMSGTFSYCNSLTTTPTIPSSVTDMTATFQNCTSLTTAPTIPNSVTNMYSTFSGCTSLTTPPDMSNASSVTNMDWTFYGCTPLTTAPTIPNSVTDMEQTFYGCTSLTTAPTIPNSVTGMFQTFANCTSLTTAPVIPSSVTYMGSTFNGCTSLSGTIEINANPTEYYECFKNTHITGITGSCSQATKDALLATK